jgi:xanthine dehydrogenase YagT iron-sulfur-binding subunit
MPDHPDFPPTEGAPATEGAPDEPLFFCDPTTRRVFLTRVAGTGVAVALGSGLFGGSGARAAVPAPEADSAETVEVKLVINGREVQLRLDPRVTLLDALREHLHLTGSKKGCDHGLCGACTVLVEGRRINSCLSLAVMHEGDHVVTVEGLGSPTALHPLQAAFVERDAFQCGYCTPGQLCSAIGMLSEAKAGWPSHATADVSSRQIALSDAEIRERMSGNICRCAAYPNIVAAIRDAAGGASL